MISQRQVAAHSESRQLDLFETDSKLETPPSLPKKVASCGQTLTRGMSVSGCTYICTSASDKNVLIGTITSGPCGCGRLNASYINTVKDSLQLNVALTI